MLKGFRDFIMRGNVIDLAVAVIIGAAFKDIVDRFVGGIVNPLLGKLVGQPNFDGLVVGDFKIGYVLTAAVNFVLTAAVIYFCLVVPMNAALRRLSRGDVKEPPPPAPDVAVLMEIRDLLKARS